MFAQWGCLPRGVSAQGVSAQGMSAQGVSAQGVSAQGVSAQGGVCLGGLNLPTPCGQIDTCENNLSAITVARTVIKTFCCSYHNIHLIHWNNPDIHHKHFLLEHIAHLNRPSQCHFHNEL